MEAKNMRKADRKGWYRNTDLGCELKTVLSSDKRMKTGKDYLGMLRRDSDAINDEFFCRDPHYTFVESLPWMTKRNPRVFRGKYITLTRRLDGSLRPNFKRMDVSGNFSVECYAFGVYLELRQALMGLVGER